VSAVNFVTTAPHEFGANLVFEDMELRPYFAMRSCVQELNGGESDIGTFRHNSHSYTVSVGYQDSGLAPRPEDEIQDVKEYRLSVKDKEAPERKADFLVQPRWHKMKTTEGESVSAPNIVGVNVKTQGSNIEFEEYPKLLRKAAHVADVNPDYFRDMHPYTAVYDAARYVRIRRSKSGKIHGQNGIIRRIGELTQEEGYTKMVFNDKNVRGYYYTVEFNSDGARRLLDHRYAKEVKHYHVKNPQNVEGALQHPKLEASYQNSKDDHHVSWDNVEDLSRELEETLLNVLEWADLPTTGDGFHFVSDEYHEHNNEERERQIIENPLPELREKQEAIVVQKLREMNDTDVDVLRSVVEDGNGKTAKELEEETGYHLSTVYRAVNRAEELVNSDNGKIVAASKYMARRLNDAVKEAERRAKDALDLSAKIMEKSADELERRGGALKEWFDTYGVEMTDDPKDRLELQIGRKNGRDIKEIMREGLRAWTRAGREDSRFLTGEVCHRNHEYNAPEYRKVRCVLGMRRSTRNRR
jgi:hypothetical protein